MQPFDHERNTFCSCGMSPKICLYLNFYDILDSVSLWSIWTFIDNFEMCMSFGLHDCCGWEVKCFDPCLLSLQSLVVRNRCVIKHFCGVSMFLCFYVCLLGVLVIRLNLISSIFSYFVKEYLYRLLYNCYCADAIQKYFS